MEVAAADGSSLVKVLRTCRACGKSYRVKLSQAKKGSSYCSQLCMGRDYKTRLLGSANPNFRDLKPRPCSQCGQDFMSYKKPQRWCSRPCYEASPEGQLNARMNGRKGGGGRKDNNHAEIVARLEAEGISVLDTSTIGGGFPDLICGVSGTIILAEIKNPQSHHGKRGFSESQLGWIERWQGAPPVILRNAETAAAVLRSCVRRPARAGTPVETGEALEAIGARVTTKERA